MSTRSILILLVLTALVGGAAVMMRSSQDPAGETAEGPYFPELLDRSNDVAKAVIKDGRSTTTIVKHGDGWVIEEKSGYPASLDKVRELVLGLARLQRVEGKTSKPGLYGKLGLEGIEDAASQSTLLQLMDADGGTLAVVILGNEKSTQGAGVRRRMYVRSPSDPQAWLVEGHLPELGDATDWMDTSILGNEPPSVRSVTVERDGTTLTVLRESEETDVYQLDGLAEGEELDSQYAVNEVARSVRDLVFEDVRAASGGADVAGGETVVVRAFDGTVLTIRLTRDDEAYFGRFSADYQPGSDPDEAIRSKVDAWNERWRNWEYRLPDYLVENMLVSREALIKQDGEEEASQ